MEQTKELINSWFRCWEEGRYRDIPVTEGFRHTSPYGTIEGKKTYLDIVAANENKFLGHEFEIHEALYGEETACVRYTGRRGDFSLDVSEWYKVTAEGIAEIISYYNIEGAGEIEL